jgi:hypothetical protein
MGARAWTGKRWARPCGPGRVLLRAVVAAAVGLCALGTSAALADISGAEGHVGDSNNPVTVDPSFTSDNGYATVDWGDGQTSTDCERYSGGAPYPACFWVTTGEFQGHVAGYHQYAEQGTYTYTVTEYSGTCCNGSQFHQSTGTATVTDAALTGSAQSVNALVGAPFTGVIASFTDADPFATTSDYTTSMNPHIRQPGHLPGHRHSAGRAGSVELEHGDDPQHGQCLEQRG